MEFSLQSAVAPRAPALLIRHSAPALSSYRKTHAFAPTQSATVGALAIYCEGWDCGNTLQMLFGLSVLQSASVEQVESAIATLQGRHGPGAPDIRASLRSDLPAERPSAP
ncbi:MAG: hypothetical protein C0518_15855 [Opitutus sp.]|nr:hypothetical protein [Opitutus sp.]